jgi:enoyl-CoA hydratase/carnithine racemase
MEMNKTLAYECEAFKSYLKKDTAIIYLKDNILDIAVDFELKEKFSSVLAEIESAPGIKSLLLMNSAGSLSNATYQRFFRRDAQSGGNSENDFNSVLKTLRLKQYETLLAQVVLKVATFQKIVIFALQGNIALTFFGTTLAGDFRIAANNVIFSPYYLSRRFPPNPALGYLLTQYIGYGKTVELLLSENPLDAFKAKKLGLISEVIEPGKFEEKSIKIATQLSNLPVNTIKHVRKLLQRSIDGLHKCVEKKLYTLDDVSLKTTLL